MFELIIAILVFIAVITITALLFGGWLVVKIVGAMGRLLLTPFRAQAGVPSLIDAEATASARCAHPRCRAANPAEASFCRRCGAPLRRAVQHVPVRRVAMW